MRRFLLSSTLCALAGAALADDLPSVKAPPPAPVLAPGWTGFYFGFEGGVEWLQTTAYKPAATYLFSRDPALAGGLGGYNLLLPNNVLVGVEGNGGAVLGARQSRPYGVADTSYYADLRLRLGYVAAPDVLVFAAGGAAFGDISNATAGVDRIGYTLGGGVEWAFVKEFTARAEYRYTDLGKSAGALGLPVAQSSSALLAGVVYRLGSEDVLSHKQ